MTPTPEVPQPENHKNKNKNKNNFATEYHHFRLFSYLSVSVLSLSIIIGFFLIVQHLGEEESAEKNIANQKTLIENQNYLKNITSELKEHELMEMKELMKRTDISDGNSDKLDQVLEILKPKP